MSENFIYEYMKNFKEEKSGNEHKQFVRNSILEKLYSKMIFQYNTKNFELYEIINLLRDPGDAEESDCVKEIFKNSFDVKDGLVFWEK